MKHRAILWRYLNQQVFSARAQLVLDPFRFLLLYRIQLLEQCWNKDYQVEKHHSDWKSFGVKMMTPKHPRHQI